MEISEGVHKAAELVRSAHRTVILTGAGNSTSSGIPDFRSADSGLWTRFSPMEIASLSTFRYHPERFFEWLRPIASHMLAAQPNPSHIALAQLENSGHIKTIITQNIDGLHQRAGSQQVLEVHGTMYSMTCVECYQQYRSADFIGPYIEQGKIPLCPGCNKFLKPDVILFEEQLPVRTWLQAKDAVNTCDLLIVAGSSLIVMPVAGLPIRALENGAQVIVINKTPTYIDERSAVALYGDVAEIIPAIATEVLDA